MQPSSVTPRRAGSPPVSPATSAPPLHAVLWDRITRKYAADPIADMADYLNANQSVQSYLSPDHDVLEIGCGTGTIALQLAPFTRSLLATDVSCRMIEIAREKLAAHPVPRLSFAVADAGVLGRAAGAYDAVLAFSALHLMEDLDHAPEMAMQALRPGSLLISKTPCVGEMNPMIGWLALPLMRALGRAPHVLLLDGEAPRLAMVRQGLQIVSIERHGTRGKYSRVFIAARKPERPRRTLPRGKRTIAETAGAPLSGACVG